VLISFGYTSAHANGIGIDVLHGPHIRTTLPIEHHEVYKGGLEKGIPNLILYFQKSTGRPVALCLFEIE
jgi:hypothetical protein